jgi:hypothetical protein
VCVKSVWSWSLEKWGGLGPQGAVEPLKKRLSNIHKSGLTASFELITAAYSTFLVFWDVRLHGRASGSRRFEGLCCLLSQASVDPRRIAKTNYIMNMSFETIVAGLQSLHDIRPWTFIGPYCARAQLPKVPFLWSLYRALLSVPVTSCSQLRITRPFVWL